MKKVDCIPMDFLKVNVEQGRIFKQMQKDIDDLLDDSSFDGRVEVSLVDDGIKIRVRLYDRVSTDIIRSLDTYFGFSSVVIPNDNCVMLEYEL
ncbi:MAG: hypothetical protein IKG40_01380 [Bacilli bacterium]|nr:hypothetical protein [Bacilli bacterium]